MDYYDKINKPYSEEFFPKALWAKQGLLSRSPELSPLYVARYTGPRVMREYTVHDYFELLCVMRGSGEFCYPGGENIKLNRGLVLLIPKGMDHYELSDGQLDIIWVGIAGKRADELPLEIVQDAKSGALLESFEELYFEGRCQNLNCGAILDSLTALILTKFLAKQSLESSGGMEQAMRYLHDNFNKQISFSQLAHDLGYSEGYFYRVFKKNCNMTPGSFLTNIRIEHAIEMIRRTSLSFSQIAERCGIGDGLYLSTLIKNATGHSPRELRKLFS